MPKLTKRVVDRLHPDPDRDVFAWDSELRGFGIRMKPSGARTFLIQYRNSHRQTRRMVIGAVGTLTPEEARGIARQKLAEVAKGADPSADRHAARKAITVGELCEWYLAQAEAGRLLRRRGNAIKLSTIAMDRSRIERHVKPLIGSRAVRSLNVGAIEAFQADVAAGRTAKPRDEGRGGLVTGGQGAASRTVGMLNAILEHGARTGLIPENPAKGVRRLADRKRTARLSLDQLRALGAVMRASDAENTTGLAAIQFMALTGFRRQEVLGIRPTWLLHAGGVSFPDTKSGPQVRPIGRPAMDVLRTQGQKVGKNSDWLFPADRGDGHFVGVVKVLNRVCAKAGLSGVTPHVLRHTFASVAGELGYSELTIAGLLGHATKGVTQGYVHLDQVLVSAADWVAEAIAAALDGTDVSTSPE